MRRLFALRTRRGSTLVEVLVAVALMTFIFIFITAELIQSSQAENFSSNHSQSIIAANYLFGVIKGDPNFWGPDWASGPQGGLQPDPCGNNYPPYTDSITAPTWHDLCPNAFPELRGASPPPGVLGNGVNAQYMWNVQIQGGDQNVAQLTLWVKTDEGGRNDLYEIHGTRMKTAPPPSYNPVLPPGSPTAPSSTSPPSVPCIPPACPSPKPKPSPTPKPSLTPKPSPTPTGIFQ